MSELKSTLRADLTTAMKAKDTVTVATLRMALTALTNEEVSGNEAKELSDADVIRVLTKEAKKRHESAEVYAAASRQELADRELAEAEVLQRYLPQQLDDSELDAVVQQAIAEVQGDGERPSMKQMGAVIKSANAAAAGRADGSRIAAAVKAALGS